MADGAHTRNSSAIPSDVVDLTEDDPPDDISRASASAAAAGTTSSTVTTSHIAAAPQPSPTVEPAVAPECVKVRPAGSGGTIPHVESRLAGSAVADGSIDKQPPDSTRAAAHSGTHSLVDAGASADQAALLTAWLSGTATRPPSSAVAIPDTESHTPRLAGAALQTPAQPATAAAAALRAAGQPPSSTLAVPAATQEPSHANANAAAVSAMRVNAISHVQAGPVDTQSCASATPASHGAVATQERGSSQPDQHTEASSSGVALQAGGSQAPPTQQAPDKSLDIPEVLDQSLDELEAVPVFRPRCVLAILLSDEEECRLVREELRLVPEAVEWNGVFPPPTHVLVDNANAPEPGLRGPVAAGFAAWGASVVDQRWWAATFAARTPWAGPPARDGAHACKIGHDVMLVSVPSEEAPSVYLVITDPCAFMEDNGAARRTSVATVRRRARITGKPLPRGAALVTGRIVDFRPQEGRFTVHCGNRADVSAAMWYDPFPLHDICAAQVMQYPQAFIGYYLQLMLPGRTKMMWAHARIIAYDATSRLHRVVVVIPEAEPGVPIPRTNALGCGALLLDLANSPFRWVSEYSVAINHAARKVRVLSHLAEPPEATSCGYTRLLVLGDRISAQHASTLAELESTHPTASAIDQGSASMARDPLSVVVAADGPPATRTLGQPLSPGRSGNATTGQTDAPAPAEQREHAHADIAGRGWCNTLYRAATGGGSPGGSAALSTLQSFITQSLPGVVADVLQQQLSAAEIDGLLHLVDAHSQHALLQKLPQSVWEQVAKSGTFKDSVTHWTPERLALLPQHVRDSLSTEAKAKLHAWASARAADQAFSEQPSAATLATNDLSLAERAFRASSAAAFSAMRKLVSMVCSRTSGKPANVAGVAAMSSAAVPGSVPADDELWRAAQMLALAVGDRRVRAATDTFRELKNAVTNASSVSAASASSVERPASVPLDSVTLSVEEAKDINQGAQTMLMLLQQLAQNAESCIVAQGQALIKSHESLRQAVEKQRQAEANMKMLAVALRTMALPQPGREAMFQTQSTQTSPASTASVEGNDHRADAARAIVALREAFQLVSRAAERAKHATPREAGHTQPSQPRHRASISSDARGTFYRSITRFAEAAQDVLGDALSSADRAPSHDACLSGNAIDDVANVFVEGARLLRDRARSAVPSTDRSGPSTHAGRRDTLSVDEHRQRRSRSTEHSRTSRERSPPHAAGAKKPVDDTRDADRRRRQDVPRVASAVDRRAPTATSISTVSRDQDARLRSLDPRRSSVEETSHNPTAGSSRARSPGNPSHRSPSPNALGTSTGSRAGAQSRDLSGNQNVPMPADTGKSMSTDSDHEVVAGASVESESKTAAKVPGTTEEAAPHTLLRPEAAGSNRDAGRTSSGARQSYPHDTSDIGGGATGLAEAPRHVPASGLAAPASNIRGSPVDAQVPASVSYPPPWRVPAPRVTAAAASTANENPQSDPSSTSVDARPGFVAAALPPAGSDSTGQRRRSSSPPRTENSAGRRTASTATDCRRRRSIERATGVADFRISENGNKLVDGATSLHSREPAALAPQSTIGSVAMDASASANTNPGEGHQQHSISGSARAQPQAAPIPGALPPSHRAAGGARRRSSSPPRSRHSGGRWEPTGAVDSGRRRSVERVTGTTDSHGKQQDITLVDGAALLESQSQAAVAPPSTHDSDAKQDANSLRDGATSLDSRVSGGLAPKSASARSSGSGGTHPASNDGKGVHSAFPASIPPWRSSTGGSRFSSGSSASTAQIDRPRPESSRFTSRSEGTPEHALDPPRSANINSPRGRSPPSDQAHPTVAPHRSVAASRDPRRMTVPDVRGASPARETARAINVETSSSFADINDGKSTGMWTHGVQSGAGNKSVGSTVPPWRFADVRGAITAGDRSRKDTLASSSQFVSRAPFSDRYSDTAGASFARSLSPSDSTAGKRPGNTSRSAHIADVRSAREPRPPTACDPFYLDIRAASSIAVAPDLQVVERTASRSADDGGGSTVPRLRP